MRTNVIRSSIFKMLFVLTLLGLMAFWQIDFLITGISANVFLNSCIFGTFFFGVYAAFGRVSGLKNEFAAFRALREDYDDAVNGSAQDQEDPMWRYYRLQDGATVFSQPRILKHAYLILTDEIERTKGLVVTTGVMQNLLDSVDEQLDGGRSLISYITGLLVFLGLIGTFIGLMITLGSVGEIIGGLDLSGGAGAEAIQKLMNDLMIPLQGMATGFSSSLFGLITSLTLGLVALFGNQAANSLKSEFAGWLAGVAKVTSDSKTDPKDNTADGQAGISLDMERTLSVMYRVAKMSLVSNSRVVTTVESMSEACTALLRNQQSNQDGVIALVDGVKTIAAGMTMLDETVAKLTEVLTAHDANRVDILDLKRAAVSHHRTLQKATKQLSDLSLQTASLNARAQTFEQRMARRDDIELLSQDTQIYLREEFAELHGNVVDLSGTIDLIDAELGKRNDAFKTTADTLSAASKSLADDLGEVIARSRETLARLEAAARPDGDVRITDDGALFLKTGAKSEPLPNAPTGRFGRWIKRP